MNRSIGLIVLCCAVLIGFSSIPGCPKTTKKDTPGTGTPTPAVAKLTLTAPDSVDIAADKDSATFEVKIARENMKTPDVEIKIAGDLKGITLTADPATIAKDKDSTTIKVAVDRAKVEKGGEVTISGKGADASGDAKVKIKVLAKGVEPKASLKLTAPAEVEFEIAKKKGTIDVTVGRTNYTDEIKLIVKGDVKGVTFSEAKIAKDGDKATIDVTIDEKTAAKGATEVTIWAAGAGDIKSEAKTKVKLK